MVKAVIKKLIYKMLTCIGTVESSGGLVSSIPSGTKTNASSLTLASGKWLVIYQAALSLSATKNFQATITLGTDRAAQQITTGASAIHRLNLSTVIEVTQTATVYGTMYHTNGSAVSVNTSTMMAIRII